MTNAWFIWSLISAMLAAVVAMLTKVGIGEISLDLHFFSSLRHASARTWASLGMAIVVACLSYVAYYRALQLGPVSRVATVDKLSAAFVIVFAAIFLGERLTMLKVAGGSLVVIGTILLAME